MEPSAGPTRFDLREAYSWGTLRGVRLLFGPMRWIPVGTGLALAVLGGAHILISAIWLPPPLWTQDNVVDLGAAILGLLFAYAMATGLRNRISKELRLTEEGLVVSFLDRSTRELSWTDATLHASLMNRRGDRALRGHAAYGLAAVDWTSPVLLTEEAYAATARWVRARGLVLREFARDEPPLHLDVLEFGSRGVPLDRLPADARVADAPGG